MLDYSTFRTSSLSDNKNKNNNSINGIASSSCMEIKGSLDDPVKKKNPSAEKYSLLESKDCGVVSLLPKMMTAEQSFLKASSCFTQQSSLFLDDKETNNNNNILNVTNIGSEGDDRGDDFYHRHVVEEQEEQGRKSYLSTISLAILVFYNVSGGPFGIEQSVRSAGNFFALLGYIVMPFVWSVPEALVTAELGSAFPEASGAVAWVEEAFGKEAGLMSGYLNWVSGATDNAIYPALFLEYLTSIMSGLTEYEKDELTTGFGRFFIVSGLSILLTAINYTGLEIVGSSSVVICILSMSPFVIMCLVGIPQVDPQKWFQMPNTTISTTYGGGQEDDDDTINSGPLPLLFFAGVFWRPFLNNMFWNLNSFDAAASFAAETRDLNKNYARGIFIGLVLIVVFYFVPLLVATGATNSSQHDWVEGHLAKVALEIGGPWLGAWTVFGAGISNVALFEAEMSADAYQLMGMAERGYLPKILATRSKKYGTPTYGILIGLFVIILMSVADFSQLVAMLNLNYSISLLMEYAAFVKLRFTHDHVTRPYRIPVSKWGAFLTTIPPCIGILIIFLCSSWWTLVYASLVVIIGLFMYILHQIARAKNWCEFNDDCRTTKKYCQMMSPPLTTDTYHPEGQQQQQQQEENLLESKIDEYTLI